MNSHTLPSMNKLLVYKSPMYGIYLAHVNRTKTTLHIEYIPYSCKPGVYINDTINTRNAVEEHYTKMIHSGIWNKNDKIVVYGFLSNDEGKKKLNLLIDNYTSSNNLKLNYVVTIPASK